MLEKLAEYLEWRNVGTAAIEQYEMLKEAYSPTLRTTAEALGFLPTNVAGIPLQASPLRALLTTGLLGAGIGYGAGALGEYMMPNNWERGKLRRTMAILGGLGGAAVGGVPMAMNAMSGRDLLDNKAWNIPRPENDAPFPGLRKMEPTHFNKLKNSPTYPLDLNMEQKYKQIPVDHVNPAFGKLASDYDYSASGASSAPKLNINEFNQIVWADPRVAARMPIQTRAAGTGLLETAAYNSGDGDNRSVGIGDIARITMAMGTGYGAGALLGRGLGLLMGLPESTQETLKNTGMWAGAANELINLAFGN